MLLQGFVLRDNVKSRKLFRSLLRLQTRKLTTCFYKTSIAGPLGGFIEMLSEFASLQEARGPGPKTRFGSREIHSLG